MVDKAKILEKLRLKSQTPVAAEPPADTRILPKGGSSSSPPKGDRPPKTEKVKVLVETVLFGCGCKVPAKDYANQDCPACLNKKRRETNSERQKKRQARHAEQKDSPASDGRLPDGSVISLGPYDADTKTWSGSLTTSIQGEMVEFTGNGPSVEYLMRDLGRQCWKKMAEGKPAEPNMSDQGDGH